MTEINTQQEDKALFGFWVYLMTDCILFATLFATFAVLRTNTFGGPPGRELFNLGYVLAETLILLISSTSAGLGLLSAFKRDKKATLIFFSLTFILGASFLALEITEFKRLILEGNSFTRSGFLSSFFTLVGTHGLHIAGGLIWMVVLISKILQKGFSNSRIKRLTMLTMFWHFLDVVWIFIFTIVYLLGAV